MKIKTLLTLLFSATAGIIVLSSAGSGDIHDGVMNKGGTCCSTGAPGEAHTCSEPTCHGAGNGNSTTGGLPDNGGPGSMTWTSVPAMTGNKYLPNTTYHMSFTVSETGKPIFGFNAEILDNSGSTDLHIDNTIGTLLITDAIHTQIRKGYGTGRSTVCHTLNGGLAPNTCTFNFDWKSPASGIVNVYYSGVAGDNDNKDNAQDNVYKGSAQLTLSATGIVDIKNKPEVSVFPNPFLSEATIQVSSSAPLENTRLKLFDLSGKEVNVSSEPTPSGILIQRGSLLGGVYFYKLSNGAGLVIGTGKIIAE